MMLPVIITVLVAAAIWTFGFMSGVECGRTIPAARYVARPELYDIEQDGGI